MKNIIRNCYLLIAAKIIWASGAFRWLCNFHGHLSFSEKFLVFHNLNFLTDFHSKWPPSFRSSPNPHLLNPEFLFFSDACGGRGSWQEISTFRETEVVEIFSEETGLCKTDPESEFHSGKDEKFGKERRSTGFRTGHGSNFGTGFGSGSRVHPRTGKYRGKGTKNIFFNFSFGVFSLDFRCGD